MTELFGDKCFEDGCKWPKLLATSTQQSLGQLCVRPCPGFTPDDHPDVSRRNVCSLPGEIADVILHEQRDAPATVVYEAAIAVLEGRLALDELPGLDSTPGPIRWSGMSLTVEKLYHPGQQDT